MRFHLPERLFENGVGSWIRQEQELILPKHLRITSVHLRRRWKVMGGMMLGCPGHRHMLWGFNETG